MKQGIVVLLALLAYSSIFAGTLEERVDRLEARVGILEKNQKPLQGEMAQKQKTNLELQRQKAKIRAGKDAEVYSSEQLREIENIYQTWRKSNQEEKDQIVETLIGKYPKSNRTGCALLYLAQESTGEKQIRLLKQVIRSFNDCFYFDGVQTGAQARYYLGMLLMQSGKKMEAQRYFNELKKSYPDAVGHNGKLLVDRLPSDSN